MSQLPYPTDDDARGNSNDYNNHSVPSPVIPAKVQEEAAPTGQHQQYIPSPIGTPHPAGQQNQFSPPSPLNQPSPTAQEGQYFPPPPPGPPPVKHDHQSPVSPTSALLSEDKNYYPPPPGPPPDNKAYPDIEEPGNQPPPSYSEVPGTSETTAYPAEKPPPLPARPVSAHSQAPQFAPPPVSPSKPSHVAHDAQQPSSHHHLGTTAGSTAAPAASGSSHAKHGGWSQKLYQWSVKASVPINKLTNKLGSEAFWPTTMDKECDKAARILKSFCKDGFYTDPTPASGQQRPSSPSTPGPTSKAKVLIKIPTSALVNAKGLAIFTTFRAGFQISGAGGSGIVIARLPDGSWSPPSGFLVHTLGAGFMAGLDIYDCVCVLNTREAVDSFTRPRVSLGGEMAVVAGPVGVGGVVEVWSYMKSRGLYAGVQVDGTVIQQRPEANANFYNEPKITAQKILRGEVQVPRVEGERKAGDGGLMWPEGGRLLREVLKLAEGKVEKLDEEFVRQVGGDGPTLGDLGGAGFPDEKGAGSGMGKGSVRYA
ncbi:hypothetical protein F4778DRAFT_774743 [Xylariomycetidae sp. FL2044]|nr:hypothetical protein F4778DRAFT_774743 [Xylariomycetidae sp. FL2044]